MHIIQFLSNTINRYIPIRVAFVAIETLRIYIILCTFQKIKFYIVVFLKLALASIILAVSAANVSIVYAKMLTVERNTQNQKLKSANGIHGMVTTG